MGTLSDGLRALFYAKGADLTGFANLGSPASGWPFGAAVALKLPTGLLRSIQNGPNQDYCDTYNALNAKLDKIVSAGADFLIQAGYRAQAQTTTQVVQDETQRTELPHKTVAVLAGLGWIGKSCLLVTEQYGGAVRISSLLTDAPLTAGTPMLAPKCGSCSACVDRCPGSALTGLTWTPETDRDQIVMTAPCMKTARRLSMEAFGQNMTLCGQCFLACPHTQRYLSSQ